MTSPHRSERHTDLYDHVEQYLSRLPDGEDRAEALLVATAAAYDVALNSGKGEVGEAESVALVRDRAVDHSIRGSRLKRGVDTTMDPAQGAYTPKTHARP